MSEPIQSQFETINQQIKELAAIYHDAANQAKISDNELWVWYALLAIENEYTQQDISDLWSIPKQTVNSIISNLLKKGLVSLTVIPNTKNRKVIHLTESGKIYGQAIIAPIYQAEQQAFEKMSEDERFMCIALLKKYISYLKSSINSSHI